MIDAHSNRCKGFGFVMYQTEQEANQAISLIAQEGFEVSFAKVGLIQFID
jgi:hypothetical protein